MLDRVFRPPPSRWPYAVAAGFAACMIAVAVVQFQPSIASAPAETAGFAAIRAFLGAECQLDGDDVSPLMSMLRGVGVDDVDDLVLLDDDDVKNALEGQRSLSVVRRKRLRRKLLDCVETRLRRDGTRPKGLVESVASDLWKTSQPRRCSCSSGRGKRSFDVDLRDRRRARPAQRLAAPLPEVDALHAQGHLYARERSLAGGLPRARPSPPPSSPAPLSQISLEALARTLDHSHDGGHHEHRWFGTHRGPRIPLQDAPDHRESASPPRPSLATPAAAAGRGGPPFCFSSSRRATARARDRRSRAGGTGLRRSFRT